MNKLSLLVLSFSLISCSHVEKNLSDVHFPYAAELLSSIQQEETTRKPASVNLETEDVEGKSPRRVYFSSLYHQYLSISGFLNKKADIESCPQFHHDKLETEAVQVPKVSYYQSGPLDDEGKNYFPEMAFNKKFSLKHYHQSLKSELEVLCDEGVSDNYYKFDNLVTHYAGKKSFHLSPKSMEAVLKIPVFANFYLVKMLQGPLGEANHPEESRFIELTQTHWFEKYVTEASRLRNDFIKSNLVKR